MQGWKGRKTSCATKDGLFPSETFRLSFIYVQNMKLGIAVDRTIYKHNHMTRSKGEKPAEVVLLGILGRCTLLWVGCPWAGNMRALLESPRSWEVLSGSSNFTVAQLREKGWSTDSYVHHSLEATAPDKLKHCRWTRLLMSSVNAGPVANPLRGQLQTVEITKERLVSEKGRSPQNSQPIW